MLTMWTGVPALLFGPAMDLNATTTAWIGLSLLINGVLDREDILKAKSAWDTLIRFAALVMMATAILILVYFYSHYYFASTTANITAMHAAFFTAGAQSSGQSPATRSPMPSRRPSPREHRSSNARPV